MVVANSIASPLTLLSSKLKQIQIGGKSTPEWNRNDELGALIRNYNEMITELDRSTRMLANLTERETAWREMAKQVAHEIKNPLPR